MTEIEWEDSPEALEMREQMERDHVDDEQRELAPLSVSHTPAWEPHVRALINHWRDPEFWTIEGAMMDSMDCADALEALLPASPSQDARKA